jgi:hypothetical protein
MGFFDRLFGRRQTEQDRQTDWKKVNEDIDQVRLRIEEVRYLVQQGTSSSLSAEEQGKIAEKIAQLNAGRSSLEDRRIRLRECAASRDGHFWRRGLGGLDYQEFKCSNCGMLVRSKTSSEPSAHASADHDYFLSHG